MSSSGPTGRKPLELRPWQYEALVAWENAGKRGVLEAATGTGKTLVALEAIARLHHSVGSSARIAIVVPTTTLARQWRKVLVSELGVPDHEIGDWHSRPQVDWTPDKWVLITVVNSARDCLAPIVGEWNTKSLTSLLVVDECHRSGSAQNLRIYDEPTTFTLGLSATPERDDGAHDLFYEALGELVYRYELLTALDDGALAPLRSVLLYVDFDHDEQSAWDSLTGQIAASWARLQSEHREDFRRGRDEMMVIASLARDADPLACELLTRISERRSILNDAAQRRAALHDVTRWLSLHRKSTLCFHETVAQAEQTHRRLELLGVSNAVEHSHLRTEDRERAIQRFRDQRVDTLVVVRTADEGLDIPRANCAVFVAGSRSLRQRIQRLGRVLRRDGDNEAVATLKQTLTPPLARSNGEIQ